MKNPILILCLLALTSAVYAQKPRIGTSGDHQTHTYSFQKGGDSIRFDIRGKNDTVETRDYHQNSKISWRSWGKDSCYSFDIFGRLVDKRYSFENNHFTWDNSVRFYPDGQVSETKSSKNGIEIEKSYAKDGHLMTTIVRNNSPKGYYSRMTDRYNRLIYTYRSDTLGYGENAIVRTYDTTYFENGKVYKIAIKQYDERLSTQFFNEQGQLIKSSPSDSLKLIIFKDNVDCYYGLRNKNGDTIFKPRFDRINAFMDNFFVAYIGESAFLLDLKGAPMTPPSAHLSGVFNMERRTYGNDEGYNNQNEDINKRKQYIDTATVYFGFAEGEKKGVMTSNLHIVMPPQYFNLTAYYKGDGKFFEFEQKQGDSITRIGYVTRQGKLLFPEQFKNVESTKYKDYFLLDVSCHSTNRFTINDFVVGLDNKNEGKTKKGLGQATDAVLLLPQFFDIQHIPHTPLFLTSLSRQSSSTKKEMVNNGIFNAATKRWLLDTIGFVVHSSIKNYPLFFVVEKTATKKWGIMDTAGTYILPLAYDCIGVADIDQGLFWVEKDHKYQIFDASGSKPLLHKPKYDYLSLVRGSDNHFISEDYFFYFIAQRKEKWGVINTADEIVKPFDYDYVANTFDSNSAVLMVKNNQTTCFSPASLPNELPLPENLKKTNAYSILNKGLSVFFINDTGKVVIPPQYKQVLKHGYWGFTQVEDNQGHKKIVFNETAAVIDYPFDYDIKIANAESRVIVVKDSAEISYGVVSTDGKVLVPCQNYGVAIGDFETSTFFVKRDTPLVKRDGKDIFEQPHVYTDSLFEEDKDWMLYDSMGKIANTQPFRFPIDFKKGVGIGMQGDVYNLYTTNGAILTPFAPAEKANAGNKKAKYTEGGVKGFNNIRRLYLSGFYALFYNQGLTPTLILTKGNGEIIVNSGHYDGISRFYGKYALVTAAKQVGLIDSFGHEVIAPQDLRTYSGHFMDSLNIWVKKEQFEGPNKPENFGSYADELPFKFQYPNYKTHPDSLAITTKQRAALWNLLLDKHAENLFLTASDTYITRASSQITASFFSKDTRISRSSTCYPKLITVADSTIAFVLIQEQYSSDRDFRFYNFYRRNNRWEELKINDLLQIQGEKRWLMNDLITKKVKALKDQQIDCSNASAFITTVENRFMLTKDGIDFCFDSTENSREFVVISFTWAELSPFLKLKIY